VKQPDHLREKTSYLLQSVKNIFCYYYIIIPIRYYQFSFTKKFKYNGKILIVIICDKLPKIYLKYFRKYIIVGLLDTIILMYI